MKYEKLLQKLTSEPLKYIITLINYYILSPELSETKATRNRCNAQRIARPACTDATVHFLLTYRLAMLLPPSE